VRKFIKDIEITRGDLFALDNLIADRLRWMFVRETRQSDYLSPEAVGMLSVSNICNSPKILRVMSYHGAVFTAPFVSMTEFNEKDVLTTKKGNRVYEDNVITALSQFDFNYVYPACVAATVLAIPTVSIEGYTTVVSFPVPICTEQSRVSCTGIFIKVVSDYVRLSIVRAGGNPNDPYRLRDDAIAIYNVWHPSKNIKAQNDGKGGFVHKNKRYSVSGHMIYYLIGEILGLPVGIKRLIWEKRANALAQIGSVEQKAGRLWHTYYEDVIATYAVKSILMRMNIYITSDEFNRITKYLKMVEDSLSSMLLEVPSYEPDGE